MSTFGKDDLRFLASMHVSTGDPDPHVLCHQRWLEEKQRREFAEQRCINLDAIITEERCQHVHREQALLISSGASKHTAVMGWTVAATVVSIDVFGLKGVLLAPAILALYAIRSFLCRK